MSRSKRAEPVKVVIINTEYVQTDATSFKSVVQRLTGKDAPEVPSPTSSSEKKLSHYGAGCGGDGGGNYGSRGGGKNSPMLNKGMSFRDLDKLLLELPTMDDIYQLYVD